MEIKDHITVSIGSLRSSFVRTFLTILGIIIGVASIVALISIGQAVQSSIELSFDQLGSGTIFATPGDDTDNFGPPALSDAFNLDDLREIENYPLRYIDSIATFNGQRFTVKHLQNDVRVQITALYGDYQNVLNVDALNGRLFTDYDIQIRAKVAVIGPDLVEELFDNQNPIGQEIKIERTSFTVIGILESRGSNGLENPDEEVLIPLTTYSRFLTESEDIPVIGFRAKSSELVDRAKEEVRQILRQIRDLEADQKDNFSVRDTGEILGTINQITGFLTIFLVAIASISLIVGGIGVMNIMFVSITERTKEIGLRKSVGAKNRDILIQFLIESMMVSVLGGVIGIILGIILSYYISIYADFKPGLYWDAIGLGIIFSLVVGLIFGIYPARKASKLNPIDALRFE